MSSKWYIKVKLKEGSLGKALVREKDILAFNSWCGEKEIYLLQATKRNFWTQLFYHQPYTDLERLLTYNHLATALQGGFSLAEALSFCGASSKAQVLLWVIEKALMAGEPLESIIRRYPDFFIDPALSVTSAGLSAGALSQSFETLAFFHKRELAFKEKIKKSLHYPLFVLTLICGVFGILTFYVMPLVDSFASRSKSTSSISLFYLFASCFLGIIGCIVSIWALSKGKHFFRKYFQKLLKNIPFVGPLVVCQAWWVRLHVLELLVRNHYHPLKALEHVKQGLLEPYIEQDFTNVFSELSQGKTFAKALEGLKSLPTPVRSLLSLGAQTGSFHSPLKGACQLLEDLVEHHSHRLTLWLEPLSLLIMGALMIMLVLSVFGPLYHHLTGIEG